MPRTHFCTLVLALRILVGAPCLARPSGTAEESTPTPLEHWLVLGPETVPLPAFHDDERLGFAATELARLDVLDVEDLRPRSGGSTTWPSGRSSLWREVHAAGGKLTVSREAAPDSAAPPRLALAACYLTADRFSTLELAFESRFPLRVTLDGAEVAHSAGVDVADKEPPAESPKATAEVKLEQGKHLLLLQIVHDGREDECAVVATTKTEAPAAYHVSSGLSPRRPVDIADLLDRRTVASVSVSAEGDLVAIRYRHPNVSADKSDDWLEIRRATDGALVDTLRGDFALGGFQWGPHAHTYSYVTRNEEHSTLWVGNLGDGTVRPLLRRVEHLASHRWVPDGSSIIYAVTSKESQAEDGVKRMRGLPDRWNDFRDRTHLYQADVTSGTRRRLTAGRYTTALRDIAPDGRRLLFARRVYHYDKRPFSTTTLYELDLRTLEPRTVAAGPWLNDARYSPDGERVLVLAGPSAFGETGQNVRDGQIPNEYDTQAYILSLDSGEVDAITREFDPSVEQAEWSRSDGSIYLSASDGAYVRLYRYSPESRTFGEVPVPLEVTRDFSLAAERPRLALFGSSVAQPDRVFMLDLQTGESETRLLADPAEKRFSDVAPSRVEAWEYEGPNGKVPGRVYYPPDFEGGRRYPAIVYYYGGTSPTPRDFGGRYPKELWAARGYVVLVLQPSGATGFGQEYSARHVNNWGKTVVDEIVEGTKKFLDDHRFVDRRKVGCIGASYGGFMTMLLVTHTDLFSAAVSHAGISSISSYWGEGWWGYLYSSVATADSYPWNRPDIYIQQSALFRADKVETPLLLLHGTSDTNVPPGESEQMYTALKVLGKDVEYVRFAGENHWILERKKREKWMRTIIAWYDWKLKGAPEFWEHLYPPVNEGGKKREL